MPSCIHWLFTSSNHSLISGHIPTSVFRVCDNCVCLNKIINELGFNFETIESVASDKNTAKTVRFRFYKMYVNDITFSKFENEKENKSDFSIGQQNSERMRS